MAIPRLMGHGNQFHDTVLVQTQFANSTLTTRLFVFVSSVQGLCYVS